MSQHIFATSDGAKLSVRVSGAGPTLVMLHGWAMASGYFDQAICRLENNYRVIAPDFRAHGDSPPVRRGHRMARYAKDISELISAYHDGGPLYMLGWSMGASVIMAMLDLFPDCLPDAVIYVDQPPLNINTADWSLGARGMTRAAIDGFEHRLRADLAGFLDEFISSMFVKAPGKSELSRLRALSAKIEADSAADILIDHLNQDWRDVVRRQPVPALAIAGEGFTAVEGTRALGQLSRSIEVVTFKECGHCPFIEKTDEFVEAVDGFLQKISARHHVRRRTSYLASGQPVGGIQLIAFVVEDVREAAETWAKLTGIGPWFVVDPFRADGLFYRGESNDAQFAIALAASGSIFVSLIQPKDEKPSIYQEVLARRGFGALSHVAFSTKRYERDLATLQSAGCPPLLHGKAVGVDGQRFAYLDTMDILGPIAELIEIDTATESFFLRLKRAALAWDGLNPVRKLADLPPL